MYISVILFWKLKQHVPPHTTHQTMLYAPTRKHGTSVQKTTIQILLEILCKKYLWVLKSSRWQQRIYCLQSRRGRADGGRESPDISVQFSFRLLGVTSRKIAMPWRSLRSTVKSSESGRVVSAPRLLEKWEPLRWSRCAVVLYRCVCPVLCYVTALRRIDLPQKECQ